jgi:hypothetical protein
MKRSILLSYTLVFTLFALSCSKDGHENDPESSGQEWVITDSVSVNLEFAQLRPIDVYEEKGLFLARSGRDYVIFDASGEVLHQIQQKASGEPDYLGNWIISMNFIGEDELLVVPNMSDEIFITDYDGHILEKFPTPFRIMVSISAANQKGFELEENSYLLYAPGRLPEGEIMSKEGKKDPIFEIWDRTSNTFTPALVLPEGHPYTLPSEDIFFVQFTYSEGKLVLYRSRESEIHLFQWDGTDFQFDQTIKLNFPKFVEIPVKADGSRDIFAVKSGSIYHIDIDADAVHIAYSEGIEEARYSLMSEEEKQISSYTEPIKVLSIELDDLSEHYRDLPKEITPILTQVDIGRWMGLKNIYLKMEEEDFPTFYYLEKR